jgi:FMN phosphatase YigB (HAD superfamily)
MIKFIYFDVGGVVVKDFSRTNKWQQLKDSIGVKPEQEKEFDKVFDEFEKEVCVGKDVEDFVPIMKNKFGLRLPETYSFLADFVNRYERNESIWPALDKLKGRFQKGLLTNMYPHMLDAIHKANFMPKIEWEIIIDSSIEKLKKPQVEIFQLAQDRAGLKGEEILFVENSAKHVEAAKQFGWQTFLYDSANTLESNRKLQTMLGLNPF